MERKMSESLEKTFNFIEKEIIIIHRRYDCFKELFGTDESYVELLNSTAPLFFYLVQTGLYENIILSVSRLVDPAKKGAFHNISFAKLIELLEKEILGDEDEEQRKLVDELKLILFNYWTSSK